MRRFHLHLGDTFGHKFALEEKKSTPKYIRIRKVVLSSSRGDAAFQLILSAPHLLVTEERKKLRLLPRE